MNFNEHKKSKTQNLLKNPVTQAIRQNARRYRLNRVQEMLCSNDRAAILLFDPVNIRYATDTSNMQVWTLHNPERYALVFANGPVILWEFRNCENLHDDQVYFTLSDVSGKGVNAGMVMAKAITLFKIFAKQKFKPNEILSINTEILLVLIKMSSSFFLLSKSNLY